MLLDETLAKAVTTRTSAEVIDKTSKAQGKLSRVFGDHTFFRSDKGVFIVEPAPDPKRPNRTLVKRIQLATWLDGEKTTLSPIDAEHRAKKIKL